jgi:hypothetical protein
MAMGLFNERFFLMTPAFTKFIPLPPPFCISATYEKIKEF